MDDIRDYAFEKYRTSYYVMSNLVVIQNTAQEADVAPLVLGPLPRRKNPGLTILPN
jgi:hypothetical protein